MSLTSLTAVVCDVVFPSLLKHKTWRFYLLGGTIFSLLFPLITLLGELSSAVWMFLLASLFWGVYYELVQFSHQSFVVAVEQKTNYTRDWGIIGLVISIGVLIGSIIGSNLLVLNDVVRTFTVSFIQGISLVLVLVLMMLIKKKRDELETKSAGVFEVRSLTRHKLALWKEAAYWKVLLVKVWPVILVGVLIEFVDATFWSLGSLFGIDIFGKGDMDWFLLTMYSLPLALGALVMMKVNIHVRKKFYSDVALLFGGLCLTFLFFTSGNVFLTLLAIFIGSLFFAVVWPLNEAVYSELLRRMGKENIHLLGLAKANLSLAYMVAPIFMGFLADRFGYFNTFGLLGLLCFASGILLIYITPRKIRMPGNDIQSISVS